MFLLNKELSEVVHVESLSKLRKYRLWIIVFLSVFFTFLGIGLGVGIFVSK